MSGLSTAAVSSSPDSSGGGLACAPQLEMSVASQLEQSSSTLSSSSSSALTHSPSSSLTSIPTNSPTSTNFSSNPASDPISSSSGSGAAHPQSSCGVSMVVADASGSDNSNENDKSVTLTSQGKEYVQQQQPICMKGAPSEECEPTDGSGPLIEAEAEATEQLVPTPTLPSSLISRLQEESCDSFLPFSMDDVNEQQQLGMVVAEVEVVMANGEVASFQIDEGAANLMVEASRSCAIHDGDDTDIYIAAFDEQQHPEAALVRPDESVFIEAARLERSNSCSQAETLHAIGEQQHQLATTEASAVAKCKLGPTSISHEDLTSASQTSATIVNEDHESSFIPPILNAPDYLCTQEQRQVLDPELAANSNCSQSASTATAIQQHQTRSAKNEQANNREATLLSQQVTANSSAQHTASTAGTSRFFSSKLNTGSLWSLLSVGSNHSTSSVSNATSTMTTTVDNLTHGASSNVATIAGGSGGHNKHGTDTAMKLEQDKNLRSSLGAGFFSRVQQFKRQHSNQEASSQKPIVSSSSSIDDISLYDKPDTMSTSNEPAAMTKKVRFQVKYIGSAMLHKNFTLPMLEWIARDIKRQTIKGAQSTNQRQFTIPARDIILEIQSYQLMGTSCKDGHCIFVHPMHCVSKYAQLQHDPNCFSYLIRDTKESPYFCHVFQAKSTHKVHEIFSAIREATTTQITSITIKPKPPQQAPLSRGATLAGDASMTSNLGGQSNSRIQKSASGDGQTRNIFGQPTAKDLRLGTAVGTPSLLGTPQSSFMSSSNPVFSSATSSARAEENAQFENSYQFEVMFVKKVKLQCRRVPASFVDDALETLKSFDVLKGSDSKGSQIKGIGKRIISASVDERQEYDEACQSPTPVATNQRPDEHRNPTNSTELPSIIAADTDQRRGSSASLNRNHSTIKEERESRSCQQSPAKVGAVTNETHPVGNSDMISSAIMKKHHKSMGCLDNIDSTIKSAKAGDTPHYFNDFSPYNTITSSDLNERIAAIPVVSSSVSLDHEMRQKLARQVRETIMATAANIKKDVYASGDKLDSSSSFKVLDSLSCMAMSSVPSVDKNELSNEGAAHSESGQKRTDQILASSPSGAQAIADHRRSSATGPFFQPNTQTTNNFDLFRRASARQVVKNRTMLLLIGKDELCTISIDKHQVLFSKSFSSIVHCLQGNNNRDHFGLICRDSGKINPNTESYAGLIFKCQSEKLVREIMGALKQVIYNSQYNYHGYNSIYNPLNMAAPQHTIPKSRNSPKLERAQTATTSSSSASSESSGAQTSVTNTNKGLDVSMDQQQAATRSLAAKRGFSNHLELDTSKSSAGIHEQQSLDRSTIGTAPPSASTSSVLTKSGASTASVKAPKNLIKSMFCDNCPLYWYHRLCCDIESLPAEASKSIILRRVDSSLAEREQDELYSKFSDFNIESTDEHNEIFMSLLRHICERNQLKHNQTQAHQAAIAKNNPKLASKQTTLPSLVSRQSSLQTPTSGGIPVTSINSASLANAFNRSSAVASTSNVAANHGHQRSGSSGGSLGFVLGQSSNQSISDAGLMAMDNLKRAKNNLSVSIENMLKRRSSIRDDGDEQQPATTGGSIAGTVAGYLPTRSGSFRSTTTRLGSTTNQELQHEDASGTSLKRSSSTSEYSSTKQLNQSSVASWRDSFSRTINEDLTNPLMGLFRRRSSTFGTNGDDGDTMSRQRNGSSTDGLNRTESRHHVTPQQPASPSASESQFHMSSAQTNGGGSSPSSMLSGAFWKKSIFDKIRQPQSDDGNQIDGASVRDTTDVANTTGSSVLADSRDAPPAKPPTRTREELRSLWRKAILEQITLIKMDKQNQRLQVANCSEHDIQRIKLNYKDVPYKRDALGSWERLLNQDPTKKVEFVEVARLVRSGVPKHRRGEIWMFLMNQYQLRHGTSFQPIDSEYRGDANQNYRGLLSQLSTQQHEIFVDIGRTFPAHPYYSQYLSIGQLSLFNLLKAYSLLDQEVGYCQGLSFVAGILLLHVDSEDEAFELMRHLLFNFGLRKQYLPSMNALHLQLYQITRLLRDYEYELFDHLDRYDMSPSLYAAPWFLTLFASQFPLGFVARLLDLIYLMGIEAIFRVSLNLLAYHRADILNRKSLESTMDFMRNDLMKIDEKNLATIFDKSMSIDLRNKLIEYEIEYTFYCAEDKTKSASRYSLTQNHRSSGDKRDRDTGDELKENGAKTATESQLESTSIVADATATAIIQHLLANNHLKSLQSNYSY